MNYLEEITRIARTAIAANKAMDAGNGMYNFDLETPSCLMRNKKYEDNMIFQIYPYKDGPYYGAIWLLPYYKDNENYEHDDIAFSDLSDTEQKEVYELFNDTYNMDEKYVSSAVFSFIPYLKTNKSLTSAEYVEKIRTALKGIFDEFDITLVDDSDFRCEEIDTLATDTKALLAKLGYENTEAIRSVEVSEEETINGKLFQYVYVDWNEKGPDGANFAFLIIDGEKYLPSCGYPMSLADARSYDMTKDCKEYFVMDANYNFVLASVEEDGVNTETLTYKRMCYLNMSYKFRFNGVLYNALYELDNCDVLEFYDALSATDYDDGCSLSGKPILHRAFYKKGEDEPYRVEKVEELMC